MKEQLQQRPSVKPMRSKQQNKTENQPDSPIVAMQNHLGNAAVQRMLAQRSGGDGAFDLDEQTANRINSARSGGHALDGTVQKQMSQNMGADFSGVRVHTGGEAHQLNEQLSAKAFTTGNDIFFRGGEYNPQSSSGQELLAHELTHVVQQSSGAVGSGSGAMRVNAPGDRFEQEADSVAKSVTNSPPAVQRQETPEEEVQTMRLQRQELQRQEEEEPVQAKHIQRQEEEEPVQAKHIQRQEEEELQTKRLQRQEEEEPAVQMQEMPEEETEAA